MPAKWNPSTPLITSASYDAVSTAHRYVAIHFWAEWNGVDLKMDQVIRELPSELRAVVQFVSCDVDDPQNAKLIGHLSVATVPTLALLNNGEPIGLIVGQQSTEELATELIRRMPMPLAVTIQQGHKMKCCTGATMTRAWDWVCSLLRIGPRSHTS